MSDTEIYSGPERRARDRTLGTPLRRRLVEAVEIERRSVNTNAFDIAAALEMHLDQCTTRRAMLQLLQGWLSEARSGSKEAQDADYIGAVERSIEVMKSAPDVETGIAILQRK
ncbi:MAG: hypothetical protein ACXWUH_03995 [Burkholderiales bacterium]